MSIECLHTRNTSTSKTTWSLVAISSIDLKYCNIFNSNEDISFVFVTTLPIDFLLLFTPYSLPCFCDVAGKEGCDAKVLQQWVDFVLVATVHSSQVYSSAHCDGRH